MNALLAVQDLRVAYKKGRISKEILHGITFDIRAGETLGVVGESGSGKSTIGKAVLGLAPVSAGTITYGGDDITSMTRRERRHRADGIQVIFQDPYSSLNPSMEVSDILTEPLTARGTTQHDARATVSRLLDQVGLPRDAATRRSREFSGGQRQRIAIARALSLSPKLIVCDEPVSALDLTTQAVVLELLIRIQEETGVAYLFVSHDLTVVKHISHRVMVLLDGSVVEEGTAHEVVNNPHNPYTRRLLLSAPIADPIAQRERRLARLASR